MGLALKEFDSMKMEMSAEKMARAFSVVPDVVYIWSLCLMSSGYGLLSAAVCMPEFVCEKVHCKLIISNNFHIH